MSQEKALEVLIVFSPEILTGLGFLLYFIGKSLMKVWSKPPKGG